MCNSQRFMWRNHLEMIALLELVFDETQLKAREYEGGRPLMEQKWAASYSFVKLWRRINKGVKLPKNFHRSAFSQIDSRFRTGGGYGKPPTTRSELVKWNKRVRAAKRTALTWFNDHVRWGVFKLLRPDVNTWPKKLRQEFNEDRARRNASARASAQSKTNDSRCTRGKQDEQRCVPRLLNETGVVRVRLSRCKDIINKLSERLDGSTKVILALVD